MKHDWTTRVRPLTGALALLLALTVVAPPASSAETAAPRRSLRAATAAKVASLDVTTGIRLNQTPDANQAASADNSKGFFKTTKGVVVLVIMAAGVGYTVYSKDKDRIHSPVRQ